MNKNNFSFYAAKTSFLTGAVMLVSLTVGTPRVKADEGRPAVQATVAVQDDYDYYPSYETYYNRTRHEYVYHDGNAWVRRSTPRDVTAEVFMAAPSARMDFHDAPEQHHSNVVKSYPRNWVKPGNGADDRKDGKNDRK